MRWSVYESNELSKLSIAPKEDGMEKTCPSCGKIGVRYYYFEVGSQDRIGSWKIWCHHCGKSIHSTGGKITKEYKVISPIGLNEELGYSKLDKLWDQGILPQKFVKR